MDSDTISNVTRKGVHNLTVLHLYVSERLRYYYHEDDPSHIIKPDDKR